VLYRVCGLTVSSDTVLPELLPSPKAGQEVPVDVRVRLQGSSRSLPQPRTWVLSSSLDDGSPWASCAKTEGGYLFRFHGLADFFVDALGQEVESLFEAEASPATLRHLFLDQVLPLVLNLRGQDALHATSVLTSRGACAFIGPSGTGKSTLAGIFQLAGCPVLSDDCLVIKEESGHIMATPGYPGLRLLEDTLEAFRHNGGSALPVADYTSKLRITAGGQGGEFLADQRPLIRIYNLVRSAEPNGDKADAVPSIEPMSCGDAFMTLVSSVFRLDLTDRAMLVRQFHFLERVVSLVPVRRLNLPNALSFLPAVRDAVLADIEVG
jgi:hypothetical protein